ncbi:hypothetical protein [Streptomyces sp. NPDC054804]
MRQPVEQLARTAMVRLTGLMRDPDLPPGRDVPPAELLARGSCGCPAPQSAPPAPAEEPATRDAPVNAYFDSHQDLTTIKHWGRVNVGTGQVRCTSPTPAPRTDAPWQDSYSSTGSAAPRS